MESSGALVIEFLCMEEMSGGGVTTLSLSRAKKILILIMGLFDRWDIVISQNEPLSFTAHGKLHRT